MTSDAKRKAASDAVATLAEYFGDIKRETRKMRETQDALRERVKMLEREIKSLQGDIEKLRAASKN